MIRYSLLALTLTACGTMELSPAEQGSPAPAPAPAPAPTPNPLVLDQPTTAPVDQFAPNELGGLNAWPVKDMLRVTCTFQVQDKVDATYDIFYSMDGNGVKTWNIHLQIHDMEHPDPTLRQFVLGATYDSSTMEPGDWKTAARADEAFISGWNYTPMGPDTRGWTASFNLRSFTATISAFGTGPVGLYHGGCTTLHRPLGHQ